MSRVFLVVLFAFSCFGVSSLRRLEFRERGWEPSNITFTLSNISEIELGREMSTKSPEIPGSSLPVRLGYRFDENATLIVKLYHALPGGTFMPSTHCGRLQLLKVDKKAPETKPIPYIVDASFFSRLIETFTLLPRDEILKESNGWYDKKRDAIDLIIYFDFVGFWNQQD